MAAAHLQTQLLDALKGDAGAFGTDGGEQIFLTPYLALACSLLYMMASDGELEAQESSQLQAVLGGDQAVLSYALRYVQSVPVEQFFAMSAELLSVKDKWCILTNVCDALLSDGRADQAELALFSQMSQAYGVRDAQFEPYFKILALKNDKSVLGHYLGVKEERQPMTPHFALAIALLYMLTADGSIGQQEVGQLEAVIGQFDGLQHVALKYVRSVKLKQFLNEASAVLQPEQKIYILTNVCDSMLSDGEVAQLEDKLFLSMLTAFGFSEKTFARYLQVLETKNLKPFDTSEFKNRVTHERMTGAEEVDGVVFKNELTDPSGDTVMSRLPDAANQGVWVGAATDVQMGQFIARTMEDNIQSVSDDFHNQDNVVKIGLNATDGLNRQHIGAAMPADNLQTIAGAMPKANRQAIESSATEANQQLIEQRASGLNLQVIGADAGGLRREILPPVVRAQNLQEVVGTVNLRLDRFEVDHFSFLQIGRAQKFTDDFVLIEEDVMGLNRQFVNASFTRMGLDLSQASTSSNSVPVTAKGTTHVTAANDSATATWRVAGLGQYPGRARARGFVYVQWVVATLAILFAAPIDTRTALRRAVAGPLVVMPMLMPELYEQGQAQASELPTAQQMTP